MRKSIAAIMLAMLAIASFGSLGFATADTEFRSLWIRMHGVITQWGPNPAFGFINTFVRKVNVNGTFHEWAGTHAIWSNEPRRLNCSEPPSTPENFTFVCYTARLVNTTEIRLNYSDYDLYISGLWNVAKITTSIYVNEYGVLLNITRVFEPVVTGAQGELRVTQHWRQFELDITGIELLSGHVVGFAVRYVEIKICDIDDDGKVDIVDLVKVAKRYGTFPGMWNYNHDMDFNYDDKIDIGDLTTLAANIG